jgi:hypothetical protein
MSNNNTVIVQFVGFEAKPQGREYTFTVRETATEPREFTLTIPNEAFNTRRVRFQDAPDICSHRLHLELAATENHPVKERRPRSIIFSECSNRKFERCFEVCVNQL